MQIHELNNFTGTLGSGAYLAIDDGTDTGKISSQGLLAATEARIDNIIAGPAPSAEEIVDARLGADGVTYPSLGDAIRDQFSDLKSELLDLASLKINVALNTGCIFTGSTIGGTVNTTVLSIEGYRYALINCNAGDKFEIKTTGGSSPRAWAFIDGDSKLLSVADAGAVNETVIAPTSTAKLIVNDNSGNGTAKQITPDGRVDVLESKVSTLEEYNQSIKVIYSKSFNADNYIDEQYISTSGNLVISTGNPGFKTSGFIALEDPDTIISIPATNLKTNNSICIIAYYKTADYASFISGVSPAGQPILSQIPKDANYVVFGSNTSGGGSYTALDADIETQGVISRQEPDTLKAELVCPASYNLIVGDTFELFYKGIVSSFDSDSFYVLASCSIGASYKKRYIVTPTSSGTYTLSLELYNLNGELIDSKTISLVAHASPTSPDSNKNILCVGDSLTQNGVWVSEVNRRLTGTGGSPSGYNLSNITFIGNCEHNGTRYEGYGGYTFNTYNTNDVGDNERIITCTHDKDASDQHSIYVDGAGNDWKLETINSSNIVIILDSGTASTIPASGTLTWVSGGTHHTSITYTAVNNVQGNPFWDDDEDKVDFASYATSQGASSIDYVYVLLGWNNWGRPMSYIKETAQIFIDNVQDSFPSAKIVLIGLEIPSRDGLASNYGTYTGAISDYLKMMKFVHDVDGAYDELVADNTNVYHINLSGQFDTEHNMPQSTRPVNIRNSETEVYQTNGVHPAESGSLQIADAVTRHFVGLLS